MQIILVLLVVEKFVVGFVDANVAIVEEIAANDLAFVFDDIDVVGQLGRVLSEQFLSGCSASH